MATVMEDVKRVEGSEIKVITGTGAAAYGAKLSRVKVVAAYPITPQTAVIEYISEFIAKGEMKARYLTVESEHSALASCMGAAVVGARAFTATSSQGLALMHEIIIWTAASRIPLVMVNVNRALAAPWSIWTDTQDSMTQRDTGWMQVYVENNQEALDMVIASYKVGERVLLPTLINLDAFILSHTSEPVEIYPQELVDEYLPEYNWPYKLDLSNPTALGGLPPKFEDYFKMRIKLHKAHEKALSVWEEELENFAQAFGRKYEHVQPFMLDDAEIAIVVYGAVSTTVKAFVKELRERGEKVGVLRLRTFRPFPEQRIVEALSHVKKVAVLDRAASWGLGGIVAPELRNALVKAKLNIPVIGYITGLGGYEVNFKLLNLMMEDLKERDEHVDSVFLKDF